MYVEETDPKKPAYRLSSKQKEHLQHSGMSGDSQFVIDLDRVNTGLAVKFYYRLSSYFFVMTSSLLQEVNSIQAEIIK